MDDIPFGITSDSDVFTDNKVESDNVVLFKKVWFTVILAPKGKTGNVHFCTTVRLAHSGQARSLTKSTFSSSL